MSHITVLSLKTYDFIVIVLYFEYSYVMYFMHSYFYTQH